MSTNTTVRRAAASRKHRSGQYGQYSRTSSAADTDYLIKRVRLSAGCV